LETVRENVSLSMGGNCKQNLSMRKKGGEKRMNRRGIASEEG
jgi:hypothetical protein